MANSLPVTFPIKIVDGPNGPTLDPSEIPSAHFQDIVAWTNTTTQDVQTKDFSPQVPPLFNKSGYPIPKNGGQVQAKIISNPRPGAQIKYTYKAANASTTATALDDGNGIIIVDGGGPLGGPKPTPKPASAKPAAKSPKAKPRSKPKTKSKAKPKGKSKAKGGKKSASRRKSGKARGKKK